MKEAQRKWHLYLNSSILICYKNAQCNSKKGEVHPKTGHKGSEVWQMYTSNFSLTLAVDKGGWSVTELLTILLFFYCVIGNGN
jgi:hypothetical protein